MHTHANYLANYAFSEVLYIKRELVCLSLCLNMIINAQQRPKNAFFITSKEGIISLSRDACDLINSSSYLKRIDPCDFPTWPTFAQQKQGRVRKKVTGDE